MSDPRTMDCQVWAQRKAKQLAATAKVQILEILPNQGKVLGGIRLPPNENLFWPSPPWHYHYAVLSQGMVFDELRPLGMPLEDYKKVFEYSDAITFALRPFP